MRGERREVLVFGYKKRSSGSFPTSKRRGDEKRVR